MPDEKLYHEPLGDALLTDEVSVIMEGHEDSMEMFSQLFHPLPRRVLSRGMLVYAPPDFKIGKIIRITPDRMYISILGNNAEDSQRVYERDDKALEKMEIVLPQVSTNPILNPLTLGTLTKAASKDNKYRRIKLTSGFAFPMKLAMTTPVVDRVGFQGYVVGSTTEGYTVKGTNGKLFDRRTAELQRVGDAVYAPWWQNKRKACCKLVRTSAIGDARYRGKGAIIKELDPVTGIAEFVLPGVIQKDTLIAPLSVIDFPEDVDSGLRQAENMIATASMYGETPPAYGKDTPTTDTPSASTPSDIPINDDSIELGIGDAVVMQTSDMNMEVPATVSRVYDSGDVDVEYASGLGNMESKKLTRDEVVDLAAEGKPGKLYKTSHLLLWRYLGDRASDRPMFKDMQEANTTANAESNILTAVKEYAYLQRDNSGKYKVVSTAGKVVAEADNRKEAVKKLVKYAAVEMKRVRNILASLEDGFPPDTRLKVSRNIMGVPLYVKVVDPVQDKPILSKVMVNPEVYYLELENRDCKDVLVSTLDTYNNQPPINLKWASTRLPYVVEVEKTSLEKLAQIGVFSLVSWPGEDTIDDTPKEATPQATPGGIATPRIGKKTAAIPKYPFDREEFMATAVLQDGTRVIIRKSSIKDYNTAHPDNPIVKVAK